MRSVHVAIAGVLAAVSPAAPAQQPNLVGTWEWTRKSDGCSEQYVFRDDGVLLVRSGENRSESEYRMAWAPEANGRYKLTFETRRDLGGRDCSGGVTHKTGERRVGYLLFGQSGTTLILCASEQGADCIGPLRKTAP